MPNHKGWRHPNGTWREWTSARKEQKRQAAARWRSRHPGEATAPRRRRERDRNTENERRREQRFRFGDRHGQTIYEAWLSLCTRSIYEMNRPSYLILDQHGLHTERWETPEQMVSRLRRQGTIP